MPGPTNMQHPDHQPRKKNKVLLLTRKTHPPKGEEFGLTVYPPVFLPKCPFWGIYGTYITVTRGGLPVSHKYAQQYETTKKHVFFKRTWFAPLCKNPKGTERSISLIDDGAATVANAFSQPSVQDPKKGCATPSEMDAGNCGNTSSPS